jgi:Ribonuclease G/E
MTQDHLVTLLIDSSPGEFRAAALDLDGRAWHVFLERWGGSAKTAWFGQNLAAKLRKVDRQTANAFVELETGEEALLRLPKGKRLIEGQALQVRVASEARCGKLARVTLDRPDSCAETAYEAWLNILPFGSTVPAPRSDRARMDAIFEEALTPFVVLRNGGRLQIERTSALTAIDVDSAGRIGRGSAGARAVAVGRDAAIEAGRQALLRRLGGLLVIDCPGPLNREGGAKIRGALSDALSRMSTLSVQLDGPSRLGLLQVALPWQFRPVDEILHEPGGEEGGETELIRLLREAETEAKARPAAFFRLVLSGAVADAYTCRKAVCDALLDKTFHGRVSVQTSAAGFSRVEIA